jgi:hypothetical protein
MGREGMERERRGVRGREGEQWNGKIGRESGRKRAEEWKNEVESKQRKVDMEKCYSNRRE